MQQDALPLATFHVEHIVPRQHGGADDPSNLAIACHHCNLHKGPNLTGIDPESGSIVPLFNPRCEVWEDHFSLVGSGIVGRTSTGRATVRVMEMNAPIRIELRAARGKSYPV
jgi:hypothetical protein